MFVENDSVPNSLRWLASRVAPGRNGGSIWTELPEEARNWFLRVEQSLAEYAGRALLRDELRAVAMPDGTIVWHRLVHYPPRDPDRRCGASDATGWVTVRSPADTIGRPFDDERRRVVLVLHPDGRATAVQFQWVGD
jgi:hypothetical protein